MRLFLHTESQSGSLDCIPFSQSLRIVRWPNFATVGVRFWRRKLQWPFVRVAAVSSAMLVATAWCFAAGSEVSQFCGRVHLNIKASNSDNWGITQPEAWGVHPQWSQGPSSSGKCWHRQTEKSMFSVAVCGCIESQSCAGQVSGDGLPRFTEREVGSAEQLMLSRMPEGYFQLHWRGYHGITWKCIITPFNLIYMKSLISYSCFILLWDG